jgi:hypothetical protein
VTSAPSAIEGDEGYRRRVWCDADGRDVIEEYCIAGLGHGTPISSSGADACGTAGPYMLEAGISSTRRIAGFWGLTTALAGDGREPAQPRRVAPPKSQPASGGVERVIEDALRAAGLMR